MRCLRHSPLFSGVVTPVAHSQGFTHSGLLQSFVWYRASALACWAEQQTLPWNYKLMPKNHSASSLAAAA